MLTSLNILIVDDEEVVHEIIGDYLHELGHHVKHSYDGDEGLKEIENIDFDLALIDLKMPKTDGLILLNKIQEIRPQLSCVIITAHAELKHAIEALRGGAVDFLTKPIKLIDLDVSLEKALQVRKLRKNNLHLQDTIRGLQNAEDLRLRNRYLIGLSKSTEHVRLQIQEIVEAKCDTILLTGETGTGKEIVAREIHYANCSDEKPFIAVSCPGLPDSLIESQLFGHVKGSFTGATTDSAGYFELADNGTLFLDEVADLSLSAQAALLRVLETRTFKRIGGSEDINVNLRIIAATNASLSEFVRNGKLRKDLFYRLNVYNIKLLPLRDRVDDIIPLAEHFLRSYFETKGFIALDFTEKAKSLLQQYDYPGNARELKNIVERAAIFSIANKSNKIGENHLILMENIFHQEKAKENQHGEISELDRILKVLEETQWNRRKAADILGITYATLRYKIRALGISKK